jgi:hypothetical protein
MKLTELEVQILAHRLEVPECISECISESEGLQDLGLETYDDRVDEACMLLLDLLRKYSKLPAKGDRLLAYILSDAVEGSTFYAMASDEPPRVQAEILKAGASLAKKVTKVCREYDPTFGGGELTFPDF